MTTEATAPAEAPASAETGPAPRRRGWSRLLTALAVLALLVGLISLAAGQYLFDEGWQNYFEKSAAWDRYRLPWLPRLAPAIVGLVAGGLLSALALRRLAPASFVEHTVPARSVAPRPRLAWALIGVAAALAVGLSLHILLARPEQWDDATRRLFYMQVRPALFVLSLALGGLGCALFGRREAGRPLPFDRWDAAWIVGAMALFAAFTVPTLTDWRYNYIGDEYAFYQVAYELSSGGPFDMFWQAGVYSTHPLVSSWIPSVTMRIFGDGIFGWKMGLVLVSVIVIPPTYLLGRWLFDRTTAQVAAAVVATSHYLFAYSHAGHNNPDSVFWVALTMLLAMLALTRPSPLLWYAAGAAAGLSLYFFFAARVAGPLLAIAMLSRGRRRFAAGLGPALLGCVLAVAPFVARNQLETVTRMLVESATTKSLPFGASLLQAGKLTLWSALAFHWSESHGLYISLGLLDPLSAVLSLVGVVGAFVRFRDWRRRLLVLGYGTILLITGGLARHEGISVPRLLVAIPLLAVFAGDTASRLLRVLTAGLGPVARRGARLASVAALFAVLAGANLYRFRVVTPARNETPPESLLVQALYSPECRAAGARPIVLAGRAGAMVWMMSGFEPNSYEPLMIESAELAAIPAYQRWPCVVAYEGKSEPARQLQRLAAARNPDARVVTFKDAAGVRDAIAVLQPPDPSAEAPLPRPGGRLYAVARSNLRRGGGAGALDDGADLATGADGRRYLVDRANRRVAEFDRQDRETARWGDRTSLVSPIAAAVDDAGMLVIDGGARTIVRFDRERRLVETRSWTELGLGLPRALAIGRDGTVVVADESPTALVAFDRGLGAMRRLVDAAGDPERDRPFRFGGVRVASDGSYVAYEGEQGSRVRRYAPDGALLASWDSGVRAGRIGAGPDGDVWLAGPQGRGILRYSPTGQKIADWPQSTLVGGSGEGGAAGIVVEADAVTVLWRFTSLVTYRLTP